MKISGTEVTSEVTGAVYLAENIVYLLITCLYVDNGGNTVYITDFVSFNFENGA
jgi:hypothetical protein